MTTAHAPLLVRTTALVVLLASVGMALLGAWRIGVTTDEPFHVERYSNFRETGWYVADYQLLDGEPAPGVRDQYVYGPAAMQVLHAIGRAAGTDPAGGVGPDARSYAVRHLATAGIGLLGLAAVIGLGRIVLRRWHWGVVAGGVLGSLPLWTGYTMFNLKDVPAATGYTVFTLGLMLITRNEHQRVFARMAPALLLASGLFLAVGTRPGLWVGPGIGVAVVVVALSAGWDGTRWTVVRAAQLTTGLLVGALALAFSYPQVFGRPWSAAYRSVTESSSYGDVAASRLYVPAHVLTDVPTGIVALALLGTVGTLLRLLPRGHAPGGHSTALVLVLAQAWSLPGTTVLRESSLNGGLRQLLFAAPAVAVLAVVGMATVLERGRRSSRAPVRILVSGLCAAAMAVPCIDQALMFPYNYGYGSPITLLTGRDTVLGDYFGAARRELGTTIDRDAQVICNRRLAPDGSLARFPVQYSDDDCPTLTAYRGSGRHDLEARDFYALLPDIVPSNCASTKEVTRPLHGRRLVLGRLLRCERELPTVPTAGADLRRPLDRGGVAAWVQARTLLAGGWFHPSLGSSDPWGSGARATGREALLVFRRPSPDREATLLLTFDRADQNLQATVNGVSVAVRSGAGMFAIALPAQAVAVVSLHRTDGAELDLVLTTVRLLV